MAWCRAGCCTLATTATSKTLTRSCCWSFLSNASFRCFFTDTNNFGGQTCSRCMALSPFIAPWSLQLFLCTQTTLFSHFSNNLLLVLWVSFQKKNLICFIHVPIIVFEIFQSPYCFPTCWEKKLHCHLVFACSRLSLTHCNQHEPVICRFELSLHF